ncbi:hypothetical protein CKO28_16120 [Rhodovibrio sodomensis]|uniref:Flagellin n=1 Tax=Rhodovibrio sodomensis TaxID=1088 RepID=A0ABS1DHU2_9PROT|nr:flagellin [Rhodovibrio sodomensis]MBK1669566.1 hypothetical protein [Rhodovibrio sodomensis]
MTGISLIGQHNFLRQVTADLSSQLQRAQGQIASGKRAETHGELGLQSKISQALRADVADAESFIQTGEMTATRMEVMQASMTAVQDGLVGQRDQVNAAIYRNDVGLPFLEPSAEGRLQDAVARLNTQVEGRYLFSGRTTDVRPVAEAQAILDGAGAAMGLDQVMAERADADLATDITAAGQITNPTADSVRLQDDNLVFGLSVAGARDSGGAMTATTTPAATSPTGMPAGAQEQLDISLSGQPAAGDSVTVDVRLPDGSAIELTLTAGNTNTAVADPELGGGAQQLSATFDRGVDAASAATSLRQALSDALAAIQDSAAFSGAAEAQGANDFFRDGGPLIVDGAGTGLVAGTESEVVHWYRGDSDPDVGGAQRARIGAGQVVDYGVRADQAELRESVKSMAMLAARGVGDDVEGYRAFALRAGESAGATVDRVTEVQGRLGVKEQLVADTIQRHEGAANLMSQRVAEIEEADPYEVATRIQELRQQLESTYAITGRLQNLSLVNFMT